METPAVDVYVGAFLARYRADIDEPGLHGLIASSDGPSRLLVTDDRAHGALVAAANSERFWEGLPAAAIVSA